MRAHLAVEQGIATVTLANAPLGDLDLARLDLLRGPEVKGCLVMASKDIWQSADSDAERLAALIATLDVPTAAVANALACADGSPLVRACDYRFDSAEAARAFLGSLVGGRAPGLVHAILVAIRNSVSLPIDEALALEAALFWQAARDLTAEKR
jgi:enoyl-CoA hydratase/carnithine racemase